MPADFDKCNREGGKIRTKTLSGGRHMLICWDKNGKSHAGEVKITKKDGFLKKKE